MIINITNPKYKIINSLIGWKITCLPEIIEKKKLSVIQEWEKRRERNKFSTSFQPVRPTNCLLRAKEV